MYILTARSRDRRIPFHAGSPMMSHHRRRPDTDFKPTCIVGLGSVASDGPAAAAVPDGFVGARRQGRRVRPGSWSFATSVRPRSVDPPLQAGVPGSRAGRQRDRSPGVSSANCPAKRCASMCIVSGVTTTCGPDSHGRPGGRRGLALLSADRASYEPGAAHSWWEIRRCRSLEQ